MVSETKCYLSNRMECLTYLSTFVVAVKNPNFKFPLISDKYNIMIAVQKLKFMQEYTSAFSVECLHSSLQAKLRITAHVQNMQKIFL